jgi:oxysterol-binding protein-related protein 9/10/11
MVNIAYWCERPELFAAIAAGKTPEERSIAVLRWFIVRLSFPLCCRSLY